MTKKILQQTLVLAVCWVLVVGVGIYLTFVRQPSELQRLEDAVQVERLKRAEVASLLDELMSSREEAEAAVQRWHVRYKTIPDTLTSPAVVGQLTRLTQGGFKSADVAYEGVVQQPDVSYHSFRVQGEGYFTSLYRFIWELENSRPLYRIDGLTLDHIDLMTDHPETGREQMLVMVSFTLNVRAYYGGTDVAQAPPIALAQLDGEFPKGAQVPVGLLPNERPAVNPFFPGIMDQLPPNTHGLVDVEAAQLVSIVGNEAVFKDASGYRAVGVGEDVYLGQVVEVDPTAEQVVVRLNKGGIIDEIELDLATGERFRQALGPTTLLPTDAK